MYVNYDSALEMTGLQKLHKRREHRGLKFALRSLRQKSTQDIFPHNLSKDTHSLRHREKFKVNKCYTENYRKSTIPYIQGRLNNHFLKLDALKRKASKRGPD